MREIEADFAALLKLLPIARLCESAFVIPVAVLLGTILALIVNPARIQVVHSIVVGLFAPGASGLSARLVPLNRFGLIPTGFPSISWECGFLIGSAWLTIRWLRAQVSGRMLIWGVATLGVLGTAALVLWTTVIQLWAVAEWPLNFLQGLFVLGFLFGYAWLVVSVLRFWHRSVCRRCPICLHRLRMPLAQGALHNLLLDPYEVASVCIHGHGTLSESRWRRAFNPPAGFWRELFVERGGS
ncbi:MAG: hypothetical protein JOY54_07205 [Acidobacteriaceae bacterium]|nr:hypothetical protein [Acidobacteriaceae bacterium]